MKHLLLVHHSQTGGIAAMAQAVLDGGDRGVLRGRGVVRVDVRGFVRGAQRADGGAGDGARGGCVRGGGGGAGVVGGAGAGGAAVPEVLV